MDRRRELIGSTESGGSGILMGRPDRLKAAPAFPGLHRIVIRAERLHNAIAHRALKRMQVGTQECRHDLGEHHLGLAFWTGRTLNGGERNDGRQGLRFCHNASFEELSATLGIIGPVQRAELQLNEYARPVARSLFNIAQFPKTASCFFLFSTESFSVHQNPEIYLQKRTARLSPAVQVREETPWEGSNSGELSLILFCRSKSPAH
jgi:hypothetical protein